MTKKSRKLWAFGLISFVVVSALACMLYLPYLMTYSFLHPARLALKRFPPDVDIAHYQEAQFVTSDGLMLKGWYVPPQNSKIVIFVHGLGGDRTELLDEAGFITAQGYGALLFDLRAHGQSEGNISTMGYSERRDIRAAVDFVRSQAGADSLVVLFGHSMGSGAVLMAAAEMPEIGAVIVESSFSTLEDNLNESVRALTSLPPFPFAPLVVFFGQQQTGLDIRAVRPLDVIAQISPRAVLLIHGDRDATIPVRNSYALYEAAREPKQLYILPGVGHEGFLQAQPQAYPATILRFLDTYLK